MRYITEKDLVVFDEYSRLLDDHIRLNKEWKELVQRHYNGEMSYEDTRPKFEESLEAFYRWEEFRKKNTAILLAQVQK